jgi:putative nucleotidyltransferase with HDIG domain
MDNRIDYFLNKSKHFPTLPTIYTSLMNVLSNPRSTIQDVTDVISRDQSSASKLLKIANSSLFSIQGNINTISQAVFYLGFNEVKNILLALSVMDIFSQVSNSSNANIVHLWKHSISVGVISKLLSGKLGLKDTEDFFIAGILHDIGKLFFIHSFKDEYDSLITEAKENSRRLIDLEFEKYGTTHDIVGGVLAEKWNLPLSLRNIIKYHNHGAIIGKTDILLSTVHISNIISIMKETDTLGDVFVPQPNFKVWSVLKLPPNTFGGMHESIISTTESAYAILKI